METEGNQQSQRRYHHRWSRPRWHSSHIRCKSGFWENIIFSGDGLNFKEGFFQLTNKFYRILAHFIVTNTSDITWAYIHDREINFGCKNVAIRNATKTYSNINLLLNTYSCVLVECEIPTGGVSSKLVLFALLPASLRTVSFSCSQKVRSCALPRHKAANVILQIYF